MMLPRPTICPHCGYFMDVATHPVDDRIRPKPGDVSVCLSCGALLVFTDDMGQRSATAEEEASLPPDIAEQVRRYRVARQAVVPPGGLARREHSA